MASHEHDLTARLAGVERALRRTRLLAGAAVIGLLTTWVGGAAWQAVPQDQDRVQTKLLIIQDNEGRDRIVLGAPMPDGRDYVGMKILNADGAEQFGLGLKTDGGVSMGFDTRPGVGNPGNRERLNMGVTAGTAVSGLARRPADPRASNPVLRRADSGVGTLARPAPAVTSVPSDKRMDQPSAYVCKGSR
jgi:hypothetical protein